MVMNSHWILDLSACSCWWLMGSSQCCFLGFAATLHIGLHMVNCDQNFSQMNQVKQTTKHARYTNWEDLDSHMFFWFCFFLIVGVLLEWIFSEAIVWKNKNINKLIMRVTPVFLRTQEIHVKLHKHQQQNQTSTTSHHNLVFGFGTKLCAKQCFFTKWKSSQNWTAILNKKTQQKKTQHTNPCKVSRDDLRIIGAQHLPKCTFSSFSSFHIFWHLLPLIQNHANHQNVLFFVSGYLKAQNIGP